VCALAGGLLILGLGARGFHQTLAPTRALWALAAVAALAASAVANAGRLAASGLPARMAAAMATVALLLEGAAMARAAGPSWVDQARYAFDALTSAWLLGATLVAMILGHYYLNIAGLPIRHLIRLCLIALAAVALRSAAAGWGLAADGRALLGPWLDGDLSASPDLLPIVVLLQRLLFGIIGAGVLSLMAWRTARISSTQSATGILYIAFIAVLVGELASRYLLFGMGRPI
jgi:hypothetical protein